MNDNQSGAKKRRNRGVVLDSALVQACAKKQNLFKQHELEAAYYRHFNIPPESDVVAPKNAWLGKRMDKKYANQIAQLLGLTDFTDLVRHEKYTSWLSLLTDFKTEEALFEWQFELPRDEDPWTVWRNVDFSLLNRTEDCNLRAIDINLKWQLTLYGEPGEQFAVFLLSDRQTTQIAPRNHPLCKSVLQPKQTSLNFPEQPLLQFSKKEGEGKRTLIVIRGKKINLTSKSDSDVQFLSALELDQFSNRLVIDNPTGIHVNTYDFLLVGQ